MSKEIVARMVTGINDRVKFTRGGVFGQLVPWIVFGSGALTSCTSSVAEDDTKTEVGPQGDAGASQGPTKEGDASVEDTTSSAEHSSTTKPATSTTGPATTGSSSVAPITTNGNTTVESSTVNPNTDDSFEDSTTTESDDPTSTATESDAGGTQDTTSDTTEPEPGGQGIFVAMGHGGRTTVSCDDGVTWTHNRFTDDIPLSGTDTDHIPFSMRAAAYDAGAFYIAWGWGVASYVERSFDGVNWEGIYGVANPDERSGDDWIWGLAAGDGKLAMGENRQVFYSPDQGESWEQGNFGLVAQKVIFGYGDGVFVAIAEGQDQGGPEFMYSDDGLAWSNEVDVPDDCIGGRVTGIPFADGTFLFAAGSHLCSSKDGGRSWQYRAVPSGQVRSSVHDGNRFISMNSDGNLFASEDALDWEQIGQLQGSGGGMAFGASKITGTLVGVRGGIFYRSDNGGESFEELPGSAYTAEGGPIVQIEFGNVASSDACP